MSSRIKFEKRNISDNAKHFDTATYWTVVEQLSTLAALVVNT